MSDLFVIPLQMQIEEVRRELKQRTFVYPRLVDRKRLTKKRADLQVRAMEAVLKTLEELAGDVPQV